MSLASFASMRQAKARKCSPATVSGSPSHQVAQPVEHLAQIVLALRCIFAHQHQVRRYKRPFFISHITRIAFESHQLKGLTKSRTRSRLLFLDPDCPRDTLAPNGCTVRRRQDDPGPLGVVGRVLALPQFG